MVETRTRTRTKEVGSLVVKRVQYSNGEFAENEETEETIRVPFFGNVEPGRVGVTGSITRNLGDFNSVRVEVSLQLPCLPEVSEAERVYNIASEFVDNKIQSELDTATGDRGPYGKIEAPEPGAIQRSTRRKVQI